MPGYCAHCGAERRTEAAFCTRCGWAFSQPAEAPKPAELQSDAEPEPTDEAEPEPTAEPESAVEPEVAAEPPLTAGLEPGSEAEALAEPEPAGEPESVAEPRAPAEVEHPAPEPEPSSESEPPPAPRYATPRASLGTTHRPLPTTPRRKRRSAAPYLLAAIGLLALLAAAAIFAIVILPRLTPGATPTPAAQASLEDDPFPASLDPGFPSFPLPQGATLVNAAIDGQGSAEYRIAAWGSPLDYDATTSFYASTSDSRWQFASQQSLGRDLASFNFNDATGTYQTVEVTVARTDPVRIDLRLVPQGELAQATLPVEGSPVAFAPLPLETALPASVPADLVPPSATLVDAASAAGIASAHWQSAADIATLRDYYSSALASASPEISDAENVTTISFSGEIGSGTLTLAAAAITTTDIYLELTQ